MISVHWHKPKVEGLYEREQETLKQFDPIRQADIASVRRFMEKQRPLLQGRVLDYGAGKPGTCRQPQPYRDLVSSHAEYVPYDLGDPQPDGPFQAIICTQMVQYVLDVPGLLTNFHTWLEPVGGVLIMSYPTNWAEAENVDLWRFTAAGMGRLLRRAGFIIGVHELRCEVVLSNFKFPIGYGVVATVNR